MTNGVHCQVSTSTNVGITVDSVVATTPRAAGPTEVSRKLSTPSCGWNIIVHTSATATGVAIIGRMKAVRAMPRPQKVACWNVTAAAATPRSIGKITARAR